MCIKYRETLPQSVHQEKHYKIIYEQMKLQTLPISELMGYKFNIPAYQRGYRWDNQQITDLLDDLLEFSSPKNKPTSYYCLQPIVVKRNEDGSYDVIDGQQRLTTIYILLTYLYPQRQSLQEDTCDQIFSIRFDKRDDDYLNDKKFVEDVSEYKNDINKFYIYKAYQVIDQWFAKNGKSFKSKILFALLGLVGTETTNVTKVIWYDVSQSSDSSIEIFTRLNYGKIPLTNAELIKALLLICDHYPAGEIEVRKETAMRMSAQWDEMENALHDPYLWNMISSSEHNTESRIGLIINKVVRDIKRQSDEEQKLFQGDEYVSLYDFSEDKENFDYHIVNRFLELNGRTPAAVDVFWQKIQDAFTVVRNWSSDRIVYHYIGYLSYLTESEESDKRKKAKRVNAFIDKCFQTYLAPSTTKKTFIAQLRKEIGNKIKVDNLGKLAYVEAKDKRALIRILLLFNIEQVIKHSSEHMLYPFQLQKEQNVTSLEHIHPQNLDTEFENNEDDYGKIVLPWLTSKERFLKGTDAYLCQEYKEFEIFSKNFSDVKDFIQRIDEHFREIANLTEEEMHTIRNMAIVSKNVNSALSNEFIDKKRSILAEREKQGDYIPPGTWMVFNKSFTKSPSGLTYWEKEDREAYYMAIRSIYLSFITNKLEEHFDDGYAKIVNLDGIEMFIDSDCQIIPKDKDGWHIIKKKHEDGESFYNFINMNGELKFEEWTKEFKN